MKSNVYKLQQIAKINVGCNLNSSKIRCEKRYFGNLLSNFVQIRSLGGNYYNLKIQFNVRLSCVSIQNNSISNVWVKMKHNKGKLCVYKTQQIALPALF